MRTIRLYVGVTLLLMTSLLALFSFGNPQWSQYVYMWQDGVLGKDISVQLEKYHGRWRDWDDEGKLRNDFSLKNGVLNGPNKIYYASGDLKYEYNFKDGELVDFYRHYYKDGKVKLEIIFHDDYWEYKHYDKDGNCDRLTLNDEVATDKFYTVSHSGNSSANDWSFDGKNYGNSFLKAGPGFKLTENKAEEICKGFLLLVVYNYNKTHMVDSIKELSAYVLHDGFICPDDYSLEVELGTFDGREYYCMYYDLDVPTGIMGGLTHGFLDVYLDNYELKHDGGE